MCSVHATVLNKHAKQCHSWNYFLAQQYTMECHSSQIKWNKIKKKTKMRKQWRCSNTGAFHTWNSALFFVWSYFLSKNFRLLSLTLRYWLLSITFLPGQRAWLVYKMKITSLCILPLFELNDKYLSHSGWRSNYWMLHRPIALISLIPMNSNTVDVQHFRWKILKIST